MAMTSKAKIVALLEEEEEMKTCPIGVILQERIRPMTRIKYCRRRGYRMDRKWDYANDQKLRM